MIAVWMRRITGAVAIVLLVAGLVLVGFGLRVRPVLSGSMQPAFSPGDAVVTMPSAKYKAGDVVTLAIPGERVQTTHRIRVVNPDGTLVTRGDHNGYDDPWSGTITQSAVKGKVLFEIPNLGTAMLWMKQHLLFVAVLLCVLLGVIGVVLFAPRRPAHADNGP